MQPCLYIIYNGQLVKKAYVLKGSRYSFLIDFLRLFPDKFRTATLIAKEVRTRNPKLNILADKAGEDKSPIDALQRVCRSSVFRGPAPFLRAFFVLLCYFNSCCFKKRIHMRFFVERGLRAKRLRAL